MSQMDERNVYARTDRSGYPLQFPVSLEQGSDTAQLAAAS